MRKRTRSRELALQLLYQFDARGDEAEALLEPFLIEQEPDDHEVHAFTRQLVKGTRDAGAEIDALLTAAAENWRLDRMAIVDRNILRMALFEMLHLDEVPAKVTINEAIELGKRFSTKQSGSFINGILDRIRREEEFVTVGFFDSLKKTLKRSREALVGGLERLVRGRKIDADLIDEVEEALVESDVGVATTEALITELETAWKAKEVTEGEQVIPFLKQHLATRLSHGGTALNEAAQKPTVILVVGVNGSGKTTSIAKLTRWLRDQGKSIVLGAGDTFRAAAVEQLTIWSKRLGVEIVKQGQDAHPAAVAFDAAEAAVARNADVLIVDTAGRLHTQKNLMQELEKIRRVLGKKIPDAPHETLLVLDGTTGQNAIQQARLFHAAAPVTGIFLTKLDGTARGGAVLSIRDELDIPVKFVGTGETPEDIQPFDAQAFVDALFD